MNSKVEPITLDAIHARLERIYAAIHQTEPIAFKSSDIEQTVVKGPDGRFLFWSMDYKFDRSDADLMNIAMSAINNIAVFRSYCIPYGATHGIAKEEVNKVVEESLALRIISDLHNLEKHPGTPMNFSGVQPRLTGVTQGPYLEEGKGCITLDIMTGKTIVEGEVHIVLGGSIVHAGTGAEIIKVDQLLNDGIAAWESFLKIHRLI